LFATGDAAILYFKILGMKRGEHKHHGLSPAKVFLFSGILILFFVWFYLSRNTEEIEARVHSWVSLILGGIALLLTIRFIR
jgi:hypothetical protein